MKYEKIVKSPLRYPDEKSKAIDQILPLIQNDFSEYREHLLVVGLFSLLPNNA